MRKYLFLFLFIGIFILTQVPNLNAQSWMRHIPKKKMKKKEFNFYDIQKAFYEYWKDRKIEKKGKGWKQFKRWEYFMESRVKPDGSFPHSILWEESKKRKPFRLKKDISEELPANWESLGPVNVPPGSLDEGLGRINAIAFDPHNPAVIWVGSPSGGLWKSFNGGSTWSTNTDDLPNLGISDIAIDPNTSNIMYIATGDRDFPNTYSYGILKSIDGGLNWLPTGLSFTVDQTRLVNRVLINPANTSVLLAATDRGIYRTVDAGANWAGMYENIHFKSMEFKPGDPNVVYASSYEYGDSRIYLSSNNGQDWASVSSGLPSSGVRRIEIGVSPADVNTVYAVYSALDDSFYGLYKSTNSGLDWSPVSNSPNILCGSPTGIGTGGQAWYDLAIAVSPLDIDVVFVGGIHIWKSTNGGVSWDLAGYPSDTSKAEFIHMDHHVLRYIPGTETLFSGNDGGIYKTIDQGINWQDLSNGLAITQFYRMGASFTNSEFLVAGAQDNGFIIYDSGNWSHSKSGDSMECVIDYANENIVYSEGPHGRINKSTNRGYGGNNLDTLPPWGTGAWVTPYVMHPTDNKILYAAFKDVYKTADGGETWSAISTNLTTGNLSFLCVAPSDPNYIYTGGGHRRIWRTTDGGANWTEINTGLPTEGSKNIAVSNVNPDKVWITLGSFTPGEKVYTSDNGGATWTNYSTGIPNIPVNCIVYKNYSNDALFVGTDIGVFYRDSDMTEWVDYSTGLPNVIVDDLEIDYPGDRLIAATYGRGIFRTAISHAFPQRDPVDIMLVLDLSGSMLSPACPTCEPKLQVLKDAVELFIQLWKVFTASGDRIGITYFRTFINQFNVRGNVLVPMFPNTDAVITDVQAQTTVSSNLTAMGGGIQSAVQWLTDDTRPRNIILFTDGMQNVNPMVDELSLQIVDKPGYSGSGISPQSPPVTLDNQLRIKVNTIGVGAAAPFGALLQNIASSTEGGFKITTAPDENLRLFYIEELVETLKDYSPQLLAYRYGNVDINAGTAAETFTVNKGARKIVLKLSGKRSGEVTFTVEKDGDDLTQYGKWIKGDYYTIFYMDLPNRLRKTILSEGNWTMRIRGEKGAAYEAAAIIDEPALKYDFFLARKDYSAGEPIMLTARLTFWRKPVTRECKVTARILKPGVGVSTLLSTYPNPVVPAKYEFEPGATNDQKKLELLLQDKKFFEQLRPEEQILTLKNNEDGTYSAEFTDTRTAGIYNVFFQATGKHPDIGAYSRTQTISTMVRFDKAVTDKSGVYVRLLDKTSKGRYMRFHIRPVDGFGNYLGPDYTHRIKVFLDGKVVDDEYKDAGDGSYGLTFFVPHNTDPKISVLVMDKSVFEGPLSKLEK